MSTVSNMFEVAVRTKMRFPFKGSVSVEDLWDLSVRNLDLVFKVLNSELRQVEEESLLQTRTAQDRELDLQIEIVKHIVGVKLEEKVQRLEANERKEKKQKIMGILSDKQDESLKNMSMDELSNMLKDL